ncbi:MAG: 1,4-dihydroxy-2-naphthoate octaprenyltransferase [Gammaproteobacteria bacterium]|nr:MAG: 1,4-dihydroxy-2-naphthoate octaprenyltransferase [Gammaproteobacteria bacterium]
MNKQTIKKWLKASRPHTMGLSVAVILAGACQVGWDNLRLDILVLSLLSAAGFQLVSNFANDYGDFKKGVDDDRPEAYRALSAGNFTASQVKTAIIVTAVASLLCVMLLVWSSPVSSAGKQTMFALGIASVLAAVGYTMGKRPYGYYALGDVMVFLFFGLVGVVGSYYLQGGQLARGGIWLVAVAFGAFSTSVLNINNLRDCEKDRQHQKITIANLLGQSVALLYQRYLFVGAVLALLIYALSVQWWGLSLPLLAAGLSWAIYRQLAEAKTHGDYNQCLAMTVKFTLLLSLPAALVGLVGC